MLFTFHERGRDIPEFHRDRRSELGGMISVLSSNAELVPTLSAVAIPSGTVTRDAYDERANALLMSLDHEQITACCKRLCLRRMTDNLDLIDEQVPENFLLRLLELEIVRRDRSRVERSMIDRLGPPQPPADL